MFSQSRSASGGRVALYVKCKFKASLKGDKSDTDNSLEFVFVNLTYNNECFVVGIVYISPEGNLNNFLCIMCNFLESMYIRFPAACVYTSGTYNIDLFGNNLNTTCIEYISIMSSDGLRTSILTPTRVTFHSKSLIDQNWCSSEDVLFKSSVIFSNVTDRFIFFMHPKLADVVINDRFVRYKYRLNDSDHHRISRYLLQNV